MTSDLGPEEARARAVELLRDAHPDVQKEYVRLRPVFETVAALIRARKEAGLTQAELAARMGGMQSRISAIESGRRSPRLETLTRVADALGYELKVELVKKDDA